VNHNGSLDEAKKLALAAKENGAEIIKFQTYKSEKLSSPKAKKFWNKALDKSEYQEETYSKLDSFEEKDYLALKEYCDFIGIEFLSTPFDLESVDLLTRVGVRGFKIASCDITNFLLIEKVAKTKLPIFLSTGASNLAEIDEAVDFILKFHNKLVLLHCVLCYPTENKDANILSIQVLAKRYSELVIGYSDHTKDIYSAIGSVALGSRVIEKHFTLSKNDSKPGDHWFAIDSEDLRQLSSGSRAVLTSLGSEIKEVFHCEIKAREQARRSIHLAASVDEGQIAKENDFIMLRPGTGIEPKYVESLVGRKYTRKIEKFEQVKKTDLV
jgi:sialic acid synthase SpsE